MRPILILHDEMTIDIESHGQKSSHRQLCSLDLQGGQRQDLDELVNEASSFAEQGSWKFITNLQL